MCFIFRHLSRQPDRPYCVQVRMFVRETPRESQARTMGSSLAARTRVTHDTQWEGCPSSTHAACMNKSRGCTAEPLVSSALFFALLFKYIVWKPRKTNWHCPNWQQKFVILYLPPCISSTDHASNICSQSKDTTGKPIPRMSQSCSRQKQPSLSKKSQITWTILRKKALAISRISLQTEMNHINWLFYLQLRILTVLFLISSGLTISFA